MKGKTLRKHSLHGKIAASALLKLFINGSGRCHKDIYFDTQMSNLMNFFNQNGVHPTTLKSIILIYTQNSDLITWDNWPIIQPQPPVLGWRLSDCVADHEAQKWNPLGHSVFESNSHNFAQTFKVYFFK